MTLALLLGVAVGLLLALTGAGGGMLGVPLLVSALHLRMAEAAPIGLLAVGLGAASGAVLGLRDGIVRWRAALLVGGIAMAAAPFGVLAAQRLPDVPLTFAFAAVVAASAWRMWHAGTAAPGARTARPCVLDARDGRIVWTRPCARALSLTGLAAGVLSGLLGVGGGFVIVPALTRFTEMSVRSVVATSLAVMALASVSGVAAAAWHGAIRWDLALPFAAGAAGASLPARLIARRVGGPRLQQAFALVSAAVALLMLAQGVAALRGA